MRRHARLILLVGMAAGPALALLIQHQSDSRANLLAGVHRKAQNFAETAALYSEATIQGVRHVLIGLGTILPQFEKDPQLCTAVATKLDDEFNTVTLFGAFDANGHLLCGQREALSGTGIGQDAPGATLPLSASARFSVGQHGEVPTLQLVEPIKADGRTAGFIVASLSLEWLNTQLGHYPLSGNTILILADREGRVLARRPDPQDWLGQRLPDNVLENVSPRRPEGTRKVVGLDQRLRIVTSAPVPSFSNDLFVVIGLDRDTERAAIDRAAWQDAAILGLIVLALIATAVASWETAGALTRHERTLSEAKATAERVSVGQQRIADTIGHDLRNSVQTLVSFLRNLRRNSTQPPDPAMLPYVARAIGDLRSSLDVLIRASRLEANALEPHSRSLQLPTFLKKIGNDWQFYAETKGLKLIVQANSDIVETDPDLLRTIVANLVSNAIKHTDSGGVTISTVRDGDGRLGISVHDTGKGIPHEKAQIIFEAFSRLEPDKTDGLGLGLSIAKRSADLLGCEIVLDRTVDSGCRFVVRLPHTPA
jgi:signal transduction histidine kinase